MGVFSAIARAARLVRGPWQFAALAVLVVLAVALFARGESSALLVASIALPLLVFAVVPWSTLIRSAPGGAILVLLVLAISPMVGAALYVASQQRERPSSRPAPQEAAAGGAHSEPAPAAVDMREMWSLAVDRLRPLILATRGHAGGFGIMLAKPDSRLDVWTSAQCVSAIVMLDERPPSELKDTFRFFESERELDGWSRWREYAKPTTEVTAWVGLAWLHSVGAGRFWENDREREAAIVQIKRIYGQLTSRQSHEGGWASYRTAYAKPSAFGDYATAMALSFLGELKRSKAIPVEVSVLDDQIRRGLGWIVDRYDPEAKGWKEPLGAVVQRDLATLNIMLLTEAKIGGLAFLESLPQLQRARDDWLAAAAEDSGRRDIGTSTQMRQAQEVFDEHGTLKREDDFTVSLMWYPWTLLAASEVARDAAAPARVRTTAAAIEERLWSRMPEAVKTFSAGVTFPAAETLYALGLARRNGVLGRSTR